MDYWNYAKLIEIPARGSAFVLGLVICLIGEKWFTFSVVALQTSRNSRGRYLRFGVGYSFRMLFEMLPNDGASQMTFVMEIVRTATSCWVLSPKYQDEGEYGRLICGSHFLEWLDCSSKQTADGVRSITLYAHLDLVQKVVLSTQDV